MTTPSRRRTDRARVEQATEAIALLDALIAARHADAQVWEAAYVRRSTQPTWEELQAMPERLAFLALQVRAEELYAQYVAKWPRPETGGLTEPLDTVLRPPDAPQTLQRLENAESDVTALRGSQTASQADSTQPTHPKGT